MKATWTQLRLEAENIADYPKLGPLQDKIVLALRSRGISVGNAVNLRSCALLLDTLETQQMGRTFPHIPPFKGGSTPHVLPGFRLHFCVYVRAVLHHAVRGEMYDTLTDRHLPSLHVQWQIPSKYPGRLSSRPKEAIQIVGAGVYPTPNLSDTASACFVDVLMPQAVPFATPSSVLPALLIRATYKGIASEIHVVGIQSHKELL